MPKGKGYGMKKKGMKKKGMKKKGMKKKGMKGGGGVVMRTGMAEYTTGSMM